MSERRQNVSPVDVLDAMIAETMAATRDVPHGLAHYGVELGVGTRLSILSEVRERLLTARMKELEEARNA